jgi:hypothetical protein
MVKEIFSNSKFINHSKLIKQLFLNYYRENAYKFSTKYLTKKKKIIIYMLR